MKSNLSVQNKLKLLAGVCSAGVSKSSVELQRQFGNAQITREFLRLSRGCSIFGGAARRLSKLAATVLDAHVYNQKYINGIDWWVCNFQAG
jgi:hypothetical protein